jgi:hypothetical protein
MIKSQKESQNSRIQDFSYYFSMIIEGSGSGSGRPKNGSGTLLQSISDFQFYGFPFQDQGFLGPKFIKISGYRYSNLLHYQLQISLDFHAPGWL